MVVLEYLVLPITTTLCTGVPLLLVVTVCTFAALAIALLDSAGRGLLCAAACAAVVLAMREVHRRRFAVSVEAMQRSASTTLRQSGRSDCDGVGVFATRSIARGERLFATDDWSEANLLVARQADIDAARPQPHVEAALDRRWFATSDGGAARLRAIPADANAWHRHSPRQYLNAAAAVDVNVVRDAADGFVAARAIAADEELLVADADAARPGSDAVRFAEKAMRTRLATPSQVLAALRSAPCVHLGASPIHGVGLLASTTIAIGQQFQASLRRMEDAMRGNAPSAVMRAPHAVVSAALLPYERDVLRCRYAFSEALQAYPQNGFDDMTAAQFLNHDATPNVLPVAGGVQMYIPLKTLSAGDELTIHYGKDVSVPYYNWVVSGAAN